MQENKLPSSTNRKISNFVFQTNHTHRRGFKSESYVESTNQIAQESPKKTTHTQTNFKSETDVTNQRRHRKTEILKENSTQTSMTTFSLVQGNTARLSPDSLSPKLESKLECKMGDADTISLNETVIKTTDYDCLSFNRRNNVMQYLESCEEYKKMDLLTGNSLTKAFLERNRNKGKLIPPPNTRAAHQSEHQTLPSLKVTEAASLKSQSYIDSPTHKIGPNVVANKPKDLTRFKVVNVLEKKTSEDKTKPVRYFCQPTGQINLANLLNETESSPAKTKRSISFMSPTLSSEKKDQSIEIKYLEKLISPTKRGRSASPKKTVKETSHSTENIKIPYIDLSESSFKNKSKKNRAAVKKCEESIEKQLQLELRLSCEDISAVRSATSTTSTESILFQALSRLRDRDWKVSLRGLAEIVEITRVSDIDCVYPHMTTINQRLIELLKSPRSHVTRTACQAIAHLIEYVKDTRRPEFDEIVEILLCKTADSNKFIRHDANLALDCMVTHIPTFHSIRAICIKGPDHKNPLVRTAAARLIVCAVVITGAQHILHPQSNECTRKRIILNLVKFLNDKSIETRKFGERLYKLLYKDRIFEVYLKRYLEREVIVKIKQCLRHSSGQNL